MAHTLSAPPVLSTPDTHILGDLSGTEVHLPSSQLSDDRLETKYEIARTIREIKEHKWRKVALQFPDDMLPDSARVFQSLARGLNPKLRINTASNAHNNIVQSSEDLEKEIETLKVDEGISPIKLTILADTSYGSCCVDEIAAEHVDADAVVHYGRACLSPTARLPVLHIFTTADLDHERGIKAFEEAFPDRREKVIVTADVPYNSHVKEIASKLQQTGYECLFAASIVHNPSSSIPNRTLPQSVLDDPSSLKEWHLFHISEPPTSLLLTLTSRVASIKVFPTSDSQSTKHFSTLEASTAILLRRRYALITSLSTVAVWGILINTLSVKNYMHMVDHVKSQISKAGKKSYLFVVGKINAAKVANFSEIGGWIVIGCWESSLIDSKEFYKPIITPFELELALSPDDSRVWTGEWRSDFDGVLEAAGKREASAQSAVVGAGNDESDGEIDLDSDEESEPPEFDLRTGRYVTKARPMRSSRRQDPASITNMSQSSSALTRRANGDIVAVNGVTSPAAEFLAQKRTWKGLGSDFEIKYEEEEEGGLIEEGRSGVASGYSVGESSKT